MSSRQVAAACAALLLTSIIVQRRNRRKEKRRKMKERVVSRNRQEHFKKIAENLKMRKPISKPETAVSSISSRAQNPSEMLVCAPDIPTLNSTATRVDPLAIPGTSRSIEATRIENDSSFVSLVCDPESIPRKDTEEYGAESSRVNEEQSLNVSDLHPEKLKEIVLRLQAEKLLMEIEKLKMDRKKMEAEKKNIELRTEVLELRKKLANLESYEKESSSSFVQALPQIRQNIAFVAVPQLSTPISASQPLILPQSKFVILPAPVRQFGNETRSTPNQSPTIVSTQIKSIIPLEPNKDLQAETTTITQKSFLRQTKTKPAVRESKIQEQVSTFSAASGDSEFEIVEQDFEDSTPCHATITQKSFLRQTKPVVEESKIQEQSSTFSAASGDSKLEIVEQDFIEDSTPCYATIKKEEPSDESLSESSATLESLLSEERTESVHSKLDPDTVESCDQIAISHVPVTDFEKALEDHNDGPYAKRIKLDRWDT